MRSMIASARGLSSPPSWSYHSSNSYWEQKIVEDFLRLRWSSSKISLCSDAFRNQLNDPKFKEVPFEDQFGMLVDIEYSSRKNNRLKRLIKNAGFDQPEANIMDINYTSGRKLNKELIRRLATCEYISEHRNLFITGATGCCIRYPPAYRIDPQREPP